MLQMLTSMVFAGSWLLALAPGAQPTDSEPITPSAAPPALRGDTPSRPEGVPPALDTGECEWSFSVAATAYLVQSGRDYVQPTAMFDHDWLHLEMRYNYEGLDTGSAWIGYNFDGGGHPGDVFSWSFTPMIGVVFGDTEGVAPGFELTLAWDIPGGASSWGTIEYYCEGEYVFDTNESEDSFFYSWSSLVVTPAALGGFSVGVVAQRTRTYETDREVQIGPAIGYSSQSLTLSAYVLNIDDQPLYALSCSLGF